MNFRVNRKKRNDHKFDCHSFEVMNDFLEKNVVFSFFHNGYLSYSVTYLALSKILANATVKAIFHYQQCVSKKMAKKLDD